jgi:hypothetical protein
MRATTIAEASKGRKVLCHNICVLIQSMFELGVDASFG